jgi:superfamily II DNA/RNA helicase
MAFFPATVDGIFDKVALHAAIPSVDKKYVSEVWIRKGNFRHQPPVVGSFSSTFLHTNGNQSSTGSARQMACLDAESLAGEHSKRPRPRLPRTLSLLTTATLSLILLVICSLSTVAALSVPRKSTSNVLNQNENQRKGGHRTASINNKSSRWFHKRKAGVIVTRRTKPPQWEREGDLLYSSSLNNPQSSQISSQDLTVEQANELLRPFEVTHGSNRPLPPAPTVQNKESIYLWGSLSVGPVWKTRLLRAGYEMPTPIQAEAFKAILSKQRPNVVIASPTGSGKTLAYLLPFLSTLNISTNNSKSKKTTTLPTAGCVWIVTPTLELGYQIRRVAQELYETNQDKNSNTNNLIYVLQTNKKSSKDDMAQQLSQFPLLSQMLESQDNELVFHPPPIFAGTPKMFLQLQKEIETASSKNFKAVPHETMVVDSTIQAFANDLSHHPKAVIFDEADRLLQTSKSINGMHISSKHRLQRTTPAALKLLRMLTASSPQVLCASATIGRSLRRQLMEILNLSSMDKAATLVTADLRTKKSADNRKSALLPPNLQHAYQLAGIENTSSEDSASVLLDGLMNALDLLDSMPSIVFPGPAGVNKTMQFLSSQGFQDIRGLESLRHPPVDNSKAVENEVAGWKSTPIYVIKERLGRGLDLPDIRYVFILGVPSNAASYAHIGGRTARRDETGMAVTVLEPKEAPKLVSLAETLGFTFQPLPGNKN